MKGPPPEFSHDVRRALDEVDQATDPADRLAAIRDAGRRFEVLLQRAVNEARVAGCTWTEIGDVFGTSKQGAQQRFAADAPPRTRRRRQPR